MRRISRFASFFLVDGGGNFFSIYQAFPFFGHGFTIFPFWSLISLSQEQSRSTITTTLGSWWLISKVCVLTNHSFLQGQFDDDYLLFSVRSSQVVKVVSTIVDLLFLFPRSGSEGGGGHPVNFSPTSPISPYLLDWVGMGHV